MSWKAQRFTKQYKRYESKRNLARAEEIDFFDTVYGYYDHDDYCDYCNDLQCCNPGTIDDIWRSFLAGLLFKLGVESAEELRFGAYYR